MSLKVASLRALIHVYTDCDCHYSSISVMLHVSIYPSVTGKTCALTIMEYVDPVPFPRTNPNIYIIQVQKGLKIGVAVTNKNGSDGKLILGDIRYYIII